MVGVDNNFRGMTLNSKPINKLSKQQLLNVLRNQNSGLTNSLLNYRNKTISDKTLLIHLKKKNLLYIIKLDSMLYYAIIGDNKDQVSKYSALLELQINMIQDKLEIHYDEQGVKNYA